MRLRPSLPGQVLPVTIGLALLAWPTRGAGQVTDAAASPDGDGGPARQASARATFALGYHGQVVPWRRFLLRALPGEEVAVEVRSPSEAVGAPPAGLRRIPEGRYSMRARAGGLERTGPRSWIWTAPDSAALHRVVVVRESAEGPAVLDSVVLAASVLVPMSEVRSGRVRNFRVGTHPDEVYRDLPRYRPPRGFIRVTRENAATRVSPRFRLGQFSVKRPATWPRYTVLHERLLLKLELLVERARRRGVPSEGWRVLSGYRSPWYNNDIGRPRFSRHVFGDAADVYVDVDGNGAMDDLNGDGRVNVLDADVLYGIVDRMDADPDLRHLLGGLGKYRTTPSHGPFIHLDTRGYRARW